MDSQAPVPPEDAVFVERIPAVLQPRGGEIVRRERRALFLQHFEPEHLQIEIVVGWNHGGKQFRWDIDPSLIPLEPGADGASDGFADPASMNLIEITGVGQLHVRGSIIASFPL